MASFNGPKLANPIRTDVPETQEVLVALAKQDPTPISDTPVGAKRLYEASSGKWQWQEYNGSSWAPVPFLQHNVDQLDGYHAAITPQANTVAVRNASGLLEDSITGNAATASSAATLSQTLPVNKGGTGATTSEAARSNLGVPPTSHASAATTHGVGNATRYGHIKLSDAVDSASGATGGTAATPAAVKATKEAADAAQSSADNAQSSADAAMTKASTLATASSPGIVKPGTGMTVNAAGALNVNAASTSKAGIVQLNDTVTSTSTTQGATANAVKTAYDKAVDAEAAIANALSVGALLPSFASSMTGYLLCNGAAVSRTTYKNLFAVIGTAFGAGNGSTTFNLPDFRNKTFWGANGNLMEVLAAGLPNLSGMFWAYTVGWTNASGNGAFYGASAASGTPGNRGGEGGTACRWGYDASRSNRIYGGSTTVQPPAITVNIFIKY